MLDKWNVLDYRKECESRLLEASTGAHKLNQMMSTVPNQPERTFDVEELQTTLRKLQEAMRMVSRVRRNLEQEEAVAYGGTHSRRFDQRACSSRSLRFSMRSDHIAQPRRAARSPNLIAKLMGLEETPTYTSRSESEDEFLGIEMMMPLVEKQAGAKDIVETAVSIGLLENNGDEDCTNIPSSFGTSSSQISEEMPQILYRRGIERKEVRRREKPHEAKPLKNSVQALAGVSKQQQQRKLSKPLLHGKKLAGPTSEAKRSTRAPVRLDKRLATSKSSEGISLPKGANVPKGHDLATTRSKKEKEAKASRKSTDIIQVTGRTTYNGVTNISQEQNSKQCNTVRVRKDSKHFCEVMVKTTVKGGRNSTSSSEAGDQFRCHNKITTQREEATLKVVDIKLLLLSSQSFINYAQELCRLDGHRQKKGVVVVVSTRNANKLLLDCARELVDRKSKYQALESSSSSRAVVRVDKLAEEIANEILKLEVRRSRRPRGEGDGEGVNSEDRTYERLEMDLGRNNVLLNAIWDQGWSEWICVEEVDYVVGPLEKMVLCGLVEELVLDLLL